MFARHVYSELRSEHAVDFTAKTKKSIFELKKKQQPKNRGGGGRKERGEVTGFALDGSDVSRNFYRAVKKSDQPC